MKIKLVDYWQNGYIDVMYKDEILAEITPRKKYLALSFAVNLQFDNVDAIEKWLERFAQHMVTLTHSNED